MKLQLFLAPTLLSAQAAAFSVHTRPASMRSSRRWAEKTNGGDADALMDKVQKIRAEIAALEGKTLEDVEIEARDKKHAQAMREKESKAAAALSASSSKPRRTVQMDVPNSAQEQVLQAAAAVERAYKDGITRQTVRFALIGEDESMSDINEWPGGAKQMYREAARPLAESLLKEVRTGRSRENATTELPSTVEAQDIWEFDGSALITAEAAAGPEHDVQALVFPNTDTKYINDIATIHKAMKDRLFLLVNPFWRNVDSWGFNILAPRGKQLAQENIFDVGYNVTYACNRFVVRGEDCVAIKAYPNDWQLFAYAEDDQWPYAETIVRLGCTVEEPTSANFTELLNARPEFKMSKNMRQLQRRFGGDE